ncbi:Hypothetical predicted protein [Xyrichtys novacula]|uniref:Uncharacterized protein n=1 Tax=Xyrichtys novacula TaxID=13765 RepID=A0AAV1EI71_XYRNO|nr:Hypothetical predicted protein [Xyrichtys novacula]
MCQSEKDRQAAERYENDGNQEQAEQLDDRKIRVVKLSQPDPPKTQQPNTSNHDIPDPDPAFFPQAPVGDGVDNSQIVFQAGQAVEKCLSRENNTRYHDSHLEERPISGVGPQTVNERTDAPANLHSSDVVGEDIGVGGGGFLLPPPLVTGVDDEDAQREEEEGVVGGEDGVQNKAGYALSTF